MNRIDGYEQAEAYTGEWKSLPAGKYVCVIRSAKDAEYRSGKRHLALVLDIAEGEFKGYFERDFEARNKRNGVGTKWSNNAVFRQGYEGNQLPYFKGLITSIEKSNRGYSWEASGWDENTLKGKKIGALFGREQFETPDGQLKWATKVTAIRSIDALEKCEIPADKPLVDNGTRAYNSPAPAGADADMFAAVAEPFYGADDEADLPF